MTVACFPTPCCLLYGMQPQASDLKKRIESLIDREYLARDPADPNVRPCSSLLWLALCVCWLLVTLLILAHCHPLQVYNYLA
jgi:hypothetical protein